MRSLWCQLAIVLVLLLTASQHCHLVSGASTPKKSGCTQTSASAVSISIVLAECGSTDLAASAIASAAVSACANGDAFAAGIGVGIASLKATSSGGNTTVNVFSAAIAYSITTNRATAVASAFATAIASVDPSYSLISPEALLDDMAAAFADVAATQGCNVAQRPVMTFYKTLLAQAPTLAAPFAKSLASQLLAAGLCPRLRAVATLASQYGWLVDAWLSAARARLSPVSGGRGCGRIRAKYFSPSLGNKLQASALAVTIANVSCTAAQSGEVAAIAIAQASINNQGISVSAISAALIQGVDLTSTLTAMALQAPSAGRTAAVTSVAAAFVASDTATQLQLAAYIAAAIANVAANDPTCITASDFISILQQTMSGVALQALCAQNLACGGCQ